MGSVFLSVVGLAPYLVAVCFFSLTVAPLLSVAEVLLDVVADTDVFQGVWTLVRHLGLLF